MIESDPDTVRVGSNPVTIDSLTAGVRTKTLRVEIMRESYINLWSNVSGNGKLFTVIAEDSTSDILIVAFNDTADKFHHLLETTNFVGRVMTSHPDAQPFALLRPHQHLRTTTQLVPKLITESSVKKKLLHCAIGRALPWKASSAWTMTSRRAASALENVSLGEARRKRAREL